MKICEINIFITHIANLIFFFVLVDSLRDFLLHKKKMHETDNLHKLRDGCICLFVTDISLSMFSSRFIHVLSYVRVSFLSKLNNLLHIHITFCFIHLSVDGQLGFYYSLAGVNYAAMNMGVRISLQDPAFTSFGYTPRNGVLNHMVILCLIFWRTAVLFFIAAIPFYNLNHQLRFQLLYIIANFFLYHSFVLLLW